MPTNDTTGSPVPGIIPEPVRVQHDEPAAERTAGKPADRGRPERRAGTRGAPRARRTASRARSVRA